MGVSLPGSGGGRSRVIDLNVVPFIDLLCATISFLLMTAAWSRTEVIAVDQALSNGAIVDGDDLPKAPPLSIHVRADGLWMGREVTKGKNYPLVSGAYDWAQVEAALKVDRDAWPEEEQVIIVTDDGVSYEHMVHALDLSRAYGYDQTLLGGGPATVPVGRLPPG